jgi:phosphopantetheine adenylyltransferase
VKEVFFLGGDVAALVPQPVLRVMAEKRTSLQRR